MVLVIDNYDSFTFNLVQIIAGLGKKVAVHRNDSVSLNQVLNGNQQCIIISPGPGRPEDAGISLELISQNAGKFPLLGVCLGHQAIARACGGKIIKSEHLMHGKVSLVYHDKKTIFKNIPSPFKAVRYHSLTVDQSTLPASLEVSAWTEDGEIMALRHREMPVEGVQFHPESMLTEYGAELINNFLQLADKHRRDEKSLEKEEERRVLKEALQKVVGGEDLNEEEAGKAMDLIMEGSATPAQIGALLTALHLKGETEDEITGFARVMRQQATSIPYTGAPLIDTCGTGGDGAGTFNISTTSALVLAGAGMKVAKHGNRSVSSLSGSADALEKLGVNLDLDPPGLQKCLVQTGFAFLYAPALHQAMKHAAGPRKELGFKTVFNILGPLTNPAGAELQVMGVYHPALTGLLARVLARLNTRRAFVIHGDGGLDEISTSGPALIYEVNHGKVSNYQVDPLELGIPRSPVSALAGNTPVENASIIENVLNGEKGPCRDAVLLNAAPGLIAGGKVANFREGIELAAEIIDSGKALQKLNELAAFTRENAPRQVSGL